MKIRIGIGLGTTGAEEFTEAVDRLEEAGVDSLWLSEVVHGPIVDPFVGMAHALARTTNLKVGTGVSVLPGRHPVLVAKQIASLAALTPRRVLPVFGLRPARRAERYLFPAPPGERAALFDESMELLRLALRQERFDFHGRFFTVEDAAIGPLPPRPVDIWLGGSVPAALRRTGRYADGWLASFLTPDQARAGREAIERAAAEAGREIEDDHYGISLAISLDGTIPDQLARAARERHPDAEPAALVGLGWADARRMIEEYVAAGLTKFVVRPATPVPLHVFLEGFAAELQPLEN
ncbi:MAG: TIGR03854 family LLM class F420-dependent oxidoreductase [Streptosporangiales bacterium]|nr:TIGR03854 family LLM class F420-dependent oxidoreductase [Streptosporangiales bacterium]